MSIIHVASVAEMDFAGVDPFNEWQFRLHTAIPYDGDVKLFSDPLAFIAMLKLLRASFDANDLNNLPRSRIREFIRALYETYNTMYSQRDLPLVFDTDASVVHRIEAEEFLRHQTRAYWQAASTRAVALQEAIFRKG